MAGMLKKAAGIASTGKSSNPHSSGMKGLKHFINEIRECPTKEAQKARVIKELGKFQFVFQNAKQMGSYQRKKYVCKLLYIFMLGYPLSTNLYRESLRICAAPKFSEKQVGYLAAGVFIHEKHELMPMLVTAIRRDLTNPSFEIQGLAVACIANIGGRELATQFGEEVTNLLMSNQSSITLKKKASLCLLRIFRKYPDIITPEFLMLKIHNLLALDHLGLLNSVMSLLQEIVVMSQNKAEFQVFVPRALDLLDHMTGGVSSQQRSYEYCGVAHPWLQVHLLRFLGRLELPASPELAEKMVRIVTVILTKPIDPAGNNNQLIVSAAVRQEAALLAAFTADEGCHSAAGDALIGLLRTGSPTVRATTLEVLARFFRLLPTTSAAVVSLHYADVRDQMLASAIRDERHLHMACIDILSAMMASASGTTNEVLQVLLQEAPRSADQPRRLIADRVARFASSQMQSNPSWYVEVIVRLISAAGDSVEDAVWQQLVHTVSNSQPLQPLAARILLGFGKEQQRPADAFMIPAAVVLGRFGQQISQEPGCSPTDQVEFFSRNLTGRSPKAHECVVTALNVFSGLYPPLAGQIQQALNNPDNVPAPAAAAPPPVDRSLQPQQVSLPPATHAAEMASVSSAPYSAPNDSYSPLGAAPPVPSRASQVISQQPQPSQEVPVRPASPHGSGGSPYGSGGSMGSVGEASVYTEHVKQLWSAGQGVLFQSDHLQVGTIITKGAIPLELSLFFGNMTEGDLTDVRFIVHSDALPAIQVQTEAVPTVLAAGQQHQHLLSAVCSAPYAGGVPKATISYVAAGMPVSATVDLPVLVADFTSALPLDAGAFLAAWNHPEGNFEAVQQWSTSIGVSKLRLVSAIASLGMAVVEGVEQQEENAVAACSVTAADLQYPVILRVEADAQFGMYRVTVKSANQPLAFAIALLVKEFVA